MNIKVFNVYKAVQLLNLPLKCYPLVMHQCISMKCLSGRINFYESFRQSAHQLSDYTTISVELNYSEV
jgi:hypothetical protein